MQLLRETDPRWETLLLQYSEVSPNIDTIFQSRNLRAKLARAQGQEKTRFETWRKVFYKNFDGGEGDYNGFLDNYGGGDYDVECEYNIRCGELVSDSIHIHSCDDNYDGADNDDRGGWR